MSSNICVSVVIPSYNVGPFIQKCLSSVGGQTYKNMQVIIIDDGYLDNTPLIETSFVCFNNDSMLIHTKNNGVSLSRNMGLNVAKGEYIFCR